MLVVNLSHELDLNVLDLAGQPSRQSCILLYIFLSISFPDLHPFQSTYKLPRPLFFCGVIHFYFSIHIRQWLVYTVNSLYSGHCRDLKLVSSVARVRNSGSLFQSNVCNSFLPGIYLLSVLSGCPLQRGVRKARVDCMPIITSFSWNGTTEKQQGV